MRILLISDEESAYLWDHYQPGRLDGIDLMISCGDLSPEYNSELLSALNASKAIGLSTTAANMLVPTKSVTAVIGVSSTPDHRFSGCGTSLGCSACSKTDCSFRREG